MKNIISVIINKPIEEVFLYSINPSNTPKWFSSIKEERTSEWPVQLGTRYENTSDGLTWGSFEVVSFEENKKFELFQKSTGYHVQYDYEMISDHETKLTYTEWVDGGELENLTAQETLNLLKSVMEA